MPERFNLLVLDTLLPIGILFVLFSSVPVLYALCMPRLSAKEIELIGRQLTGSLTLASVRMTNLNVEASADVMIAEIIRTGYFVSPKHLSFGGMPEKERRKAKRRLIQMYATREQAEIASSFAAAFLEDPSAAVLAGIDLVLAAKAEAWRLTNSDTIRSEEVAALAEAMQRCVAGCLRALSGRDDLVDGVLSSPEGMSALDLATTGHCRVILGLPEVQRFLQYMWDGTIAERRAAWRREEEVMRQTMSKKASSKALLPEQRRALALEQIEEMREEAKSKGGIDLTIFYDHRRVFSRNDWARALSKLRKFVIPPLTLLIMPLVALFPPLEHWGQRSSSPLLKLFNPPPVLRFWAFEGMNIVFVSLLTFSELPIHRFNAAPPRDWLLLTWALAGVCKEIEFVMARGLLEYVSNPHLVIGLVASISGCAALMLNVCTAVNMRAIAPGDGVQQTAEQVLGDLSMFGQLYNRCDEEIVPLAAREVHALSIFLRWLNVFPRLASRHHFYGPMMLLVRTMVRDTLQFLLLEAWVILAFGFFFWVLYREHYGFSTGEISHCDFDNEFEDPIVTLRFLWEATLLGNGYFDCFNQSSTGWLAVLFMYAFVLVSTIMLMNMLIAMMAESFSLITGNKLEYFLFDKARQTAQWLAYAPVPPPFNLLRLPYEVMYIPYMLATKLLGRSGRSAMAGGNGEFKLPDFWKAQNPLEDLAEQVGDFMASDHEKDLKEVVSSVLEARQTLTRELHDEVAGLHESVATAQRALDAMAPRMDELAAGLRALSAPAQSERRREGAAPSEVPLASTAAPGPKPSKRWTSMRGAVASLSSAPVETAMQRCVAAAAATAATARRPRYKYLRAAQVLASVQSRQHEEKDSELEPPT